MHCLLLVTLVTILTFANILTGLHTNATIQVGWEDLSKFCFTLTGVSFGDNNAQQSYPSDCQDILNAGQALSGKYIVYRCVMKKPIAIPVYCDMTTDGGGWTVFQRRFDGSQDFFLNWTDYKAGFGDLNGEFWLGNDFVSLLTYKQHQQLRIDLEAFDGDTGYAKYSHFSVGPSHDNYRLEVSGYSGNVGDSFTHQNGYQFSTNDADNDNSDGPYGHCARVLLGAWWFSNCHDCHLNGKYFADGIPSRVQRGTQTNYPILNAINYPDLFRGLSWSLWKGDEISLKTSQMMFKPASG